MKPHRGDSLCGFFFWFASPVRTNLGTGLSLFQFDIGAPEAINLGTGKLSFYYHDLSLSGRKLVIVTCGLRIQTSRSRSNLMLGRRGMAV